MEGRGFVFADDSNKSSSNQPVRCSFRTRNLAL